VKRTGSAEKRRVAALLRGLQKLYPRADCELDWQSPLELLVAVILSAQCTDKRVNLVTPALFVRYRDARAFAEADLGELQDMIRSTGFFRNKARNIQGACQRLVAEYGGRVPKTMDELLTLPGVARKTANVILGTAFATADGFVVDTHVMRLSRRLGLSRHKEPVKIERDLMARIPRAKWISAGHQLIWHGRRVCAARKPRCHECLLAKHCPSAFKA
jgi:endonuclease-3